MKMYKRKIMTLLTMSVLLTTAFMTGCTRLTEAKNNISSVADASSTADTALVADTASDTPDALTEVPGVKNDGEDVTEDDANDEESWKIAFEKSLLDNYGVRPDHYEELDDGVYQVYVEIDGKIVPYVVVDSTTGDYHG